jgi:hypothetical protein
MEQMPISLQLMDQITNHFMRLHTRIIDQCNNYCNKVKKVEKLVDTEARKSLPLT